MKALGAELFTAVPSEKVKGRGSGTMQTHTNTHTDKTMCPVAPENRTVCSNHFLVRAPSEIVLRKAKSKRNGELGEFVSTALGLLVRQNYFFKGDKGGERKL